ncbi:MULTISPECIES: glycoside hydrolase family protein [Stenotrophomonas]|jgi:lysozyme|uniref:Lysozyme n=2 Tax=Bacteria TaxID=2 RepID=A0ABU5MIY0_9GAMM|nr:MULTISPECIES: glycoside hydrolase family protein [Stenotrophomonas]KKF86818.1 lysozyme [Stenotrophomonas maltophilia]CCH13785.1 prophage LambdaSo, lysozyme, putative [Stenotrophomonas maltophilia D457]KOQ57250.1 lysozyme [Stenotrophomonas maltophilia]KUP00729.1 lysozyme [Stenotrophomonas maltophilia]KZE57908.1 lysozyme [Stenotrophomonas maltophilia]
MSRPGSTLPVRSLVAALALSAAGLIAIVDREGYTDAAVVPTRNDRPTYGFGSTVREDGTPVRLGDRTTPVRALHAVQAHLAREEGQFRASLPGVALSQGEYDVYVDFLYQYGIGNWRASSMRRHLLQGEYHQACDALLLWRRAGGYDCSTRIDGRPNTVCWGVWERQQQRHARCLAEQ